MSIKITHNLKGFNQLQKLSKNVNFVAKVGVLSSTNTREGGALTNAEIGAKHEFGSMAEKIPARSFLKMPIEERKTDINLAAADKMQEICHSHVPNTSDIKDVLTDAALEAVAIIQQAFDTGGFGKWQPLSPRTIAQRKNNSSSILIDSGKLRKSIDYEVKDEK